MERDIIVFLISLFIGSLIGTFLSIKFCQINKKECKNDKD